MNIWYFNHYAGGPGFGKYLRSFHLAKHWQDAGHRCTVFVAGYHHLLAQPLPPRLTAEGVDYAALPARRYEGNGIGRLLNIWDFCRAMPTVANRTAEFGVPDAIILSSAPPMGIFAARSLADRFRAKLVFEVRDLWPLSITDIAGKSPLHPLAIVSGISQRFAYRHADLCASLLGNAEHYMREHGLRGAFVHVPNGYEPHQSTEPRTPDGRSALDQVRKWQSEGKIVIIHPGAQGVPNALDVLVDAYRLLVESGEAHRIAILLLGEGTETERLKLASRDYPDIGFFPNLPKTEALFLTEASDIGYAGARDHRSVYQFGISFNKITDFMGAGLPVIVPFFTRSDPVSMSQCGIVTDSDAPKEIASAILRLARLTPAQRREIGLKGKVFAQTELSYATIATRYADAIAAA